MGSIQKAEVAEKAVVQDSRSVEPTQTHTHIYTGWLAKKTATSKTRSDWLKVFRCAVIMSTNTCYR